MSRKSKAPHRSLAEPPDYNVGYGKPPKETRFKPGKSGNPRGRPKGAKNKRPALNGDRLQAIILEEAYRDIPVRDGDRSVTMPMAQAIVRSLAVNAAKGQHRAQRLFADLLATTETAQRQHNELWLATAIEYKVNWERELDRRKKYGITDLPEPLPHPDQIRIDFANNTARVVGPMTIDDKVHWDEILKLRDGLYEDLEDLLRERENTDDPDEQKDLNQEIALTRERIGTINSLLNPE